jgi:hypothetical protein
LTITAITPEAKEHIKEQSYVLWEHVIQHDFPREEFVKFLEAAYGHGFADGKEHMEKVIGSLAEDPGPDNMALIEYAKKIRDPSNNTVVITDEKPREAILGFPTLEDLKPSQTLKGLDERINAIECTVTQHRNPC